MRLLAANVYGTAQYEKILYLDHSTDITEPITGYD
jgi:hypothetical protein